MNQHAVQLSPAGRLLLLSLLLFAVVLAVVFVGRVYEDDPAASQRSVPGATWNVVFVAAAGLVSLLVLLRAQARSAGIAAALFGFVTQGW